MRSRPKPPSIPVDRQETLRHDIVSVLRGESMSAREISERVGIEEKEVLDHLGHIKIALHERLIVIPALCLACGFSFRKRERLKGPGKCPVCHSERIADPHFTVN